MEANAASIARQDPSNSQHITATWIAERVVGRNLDGHLLCPAGRTLPLNQYGQPDSNFLFWQSDRLGLGCPPGSHIRRGNPRDGLAPTDNTRLELLKAANNHRILRRGRKYGRAIADPCVDDGEDRGLLFMCLNTDIARQFEFVQQTWLLNGTFATLYEEVDPLIGAPGPMTIREDPLRRIVHVETYVRLVGGDYFFLPSLSALRYLALL
jgi:deferrochelatase/peroxidase EfeB